jgi:hypothetical protein
MVEIKWTPLSEVKPGNTYFAYAGYAERNSVWSYFPFLLRSRKIQGQLETAEGLIGFTARLDLFSKKVVQLAVFEDEAALKQFAHSGQHAMCMEQTKSSMKWLKQATWAIAGSEIPPKIADAISRIENGEGREVKY